MNSNNVQIYVPGDLSGHLSFILHAANYCEYKSVEPIEKFSVNFKGTLMQNWNTANIFVFT